MSELSEIQHSSAQMKGDTLLIVDNEIHNIVSEGSISLHTHLHHLLIIGYDSFLLFDGMLYLCLPI